MFNAPAPNESAINNLVIIQNIVVIGNIPPPPTGEFSTTDADEKTQLKRMFKSIEALTNDVAKIHEPEKENNITRLVTNEFSFYTKKPLTLNEFVELQEWIADLAKKQPENLHLVLSSFAVRTPDNKIMNVVAHVECGQDPKINFILKNNPSDIDPVYSETQNNLKKIIPNLDIKFQGRNTVDIVNTACQDEKLLINGKPIHFDFNNVIECKTKGGAKFNTCIDICLDHDYGVAKNNFNAKWNDAMKNATKGQPFKFPLQLSQIVSSNCIDLIAGKTIGVVTHADPYFSKKNCKQGAIELDKQTYDNPPFNSTLNFIVTQPLACNKVCDEAIIVFKWENILKNINIEEKYKHAEVKKSFFSQYFKFQHYHRSGQINLLNKSFLNASDALLVLQQDITNQPTQNSAELQKKLLDIIEALETSLQTVKAQMIKAGHNTPTSRMQKVLDDLNQKLDNMKAVANIAPKKPETKLHS